MEQFRPSDCHVDSRGSQRHIEIPLETSIASSISDSLSTPETSITDGSGTDLIPVSNICYVGAGYVSISVKLYIVT